jgi:hypothetical protein
MWSKMVEDGTERDQRLLVVERSQAAVYVMEDGIR